MRIALFGALAVMGQSACGTLPEVAGAIPPAETTQAIADRSVTVPRNYAEALASWRGAEDIRAWIASRFQYDPGRAMQLSESGRSPNASPVIHAPAAFFIEPRGICVDLSRFAVETLRAIDPDAKAAYLMIEFEPQAIAGETLRRHWIATFVSDGKHSYFADSQRPGHLAGPYDSTEQFIAEYAAFRNRRIVAFREVDDYKRRSRTTAVRRASAVRP